MHSSVRGIATKVFVFFVLIASLIAPSFAAETSESRIQQLADDTGGSLRVSYHDKTGKVRFLWTEDGLPIQHKQLLPFVSNPEDGARAFLAEHGVLFGLKVQSKELKVKRIKKGERGRSFVRFQQVHENIPVVAGELIVQTDCVNNVISVNGEVSPQINLDITPVVSAADAQQTAITLIQKHYAVEAEQIEVTEPQLWIYDPVLLGSRLNESSLVWRLEMKAVNAASPFRELVLVDARRGFVVLHFNQIHNIKSRIIYDNQNLPSQAGILPGLGPVRTEGQGPTPIPAVDQAYDFTGLAYDFYWMHHGRDSIDNAGMALISTVRHCVYGSCPYPNAFWNGVQMVFGNSFSAALDVVSHELTHGVTENESSLFYYMQSGAINESLSDVWGELIQQAYQAISPANRWLVGEDLVSVGPFRSMSNPTALGDPDAMTSPYYYCGSHDNGGVHRNSGVNNKAAYLLIDGGSFNTKTVSAIGGIKTAKIYYEAQTNILTSGSDYADLYDALQVACTRLIGTAGISMSDCIQVKNALDAVAMNQQPVGCPATEAPICPAGVLPAQVFYDGFEAAIGNWVSVELVNNTNEPIWEISGLYASDGRKSYRGWDAPANIHAFIRNANPIHLPSGAWLHFSHSFDFENEFDGGVLEYSVDGGTTWNDAGPLFSHNEYRDSIHSFSLNPLAGRSAFTGQSNGFMSSRLDLRSLSGQNVMFRFVIGTDESIGAGGWFIDDFQVYTCGVWDATNDFSITHNPNGPWSYGWSSSRGATFNRYTANFDIDMSGGHAIGWKTAEIPSSDWGLPVGFATRSFVAQDVPAGTLAFHPGPSCQNSVIRWTAPSSGQYRIEGAFVGRDYTGPTTTDVAILHMSATVFSGNINIYNVPLTFSVMRTVQAGETIDFTVGCGQNSTYAADTSGMDARIGRTFIKHIVSGDFNGDSTGDIAAIDALGSVWFNVSGVVWGKLTSPPGVTFAKLITGNFNSARAGDEIAGLTNDGRVFVSNDMVSFTEILRPVGMALTDIHTGDFNAARAADAIAGLGTNGRIVIASTNTAFVATPTGTLSKLTVGNLNGAAPTDMVGLSAAGKIWVSLDLGTTWQQVIGTLSQLITGDINGDGFDDIVGLSAIGKIWYTTNLGLNWSNPVGTLAKIVTGQFRTTVPVSDQIGGLSAARKIFVLVNPSPVAPVWVQVPGSADQVFALSPGPGMAALNTVTGKVFTTTNLTAWTPRN